MKEKPMQTRKYLANYVENNAALAAAHRVANGQKVDFKPEKMSIHRWRAMINYIITKGIPKGAAIYDV